jgi:hypothetical protein
MLDETTQMIPGLQAYTTLATNLAFQSQCSSAEKKRGCVEFGGIGVGDGQFIRFRAVQR